MSFVAIACSLFYYYQQLGLGFRVYALHGLGYQGKDIGYNSIKEFGP
jgi:hypothetical protein